MENVFDIRLEGTTLYVTLGYELSADNAPALQEGLKQYQGQDIRKIVYDATELVYIYLVPVSGSLFLQKRN